MLQRTNIYLPQDLLNYFRFRARDEKTTMAAVIRKSLEINTLAEKTSNWARSLLAVAKRAGKSKYQNLAQNHDQYLYQNK